MPNPSPLRGPRWLCPWFWSTAGILACAFAGAWLVVAEEALAPVRLAFVWAGLLAAGAGTAIRFQQTESSRLAGAGIVLLPLLILVFAGLALTVTVNLFASWTGVYLLGMRPGLALVAWALIGPMSALAAWQCIQGRLGRGPLLRHEEAALSLLAFSVAAFLACFALSSADDDFVGSWYTMQRFLYVAGAAALVGAPLAVVDLSTRRCVVSGLVVFHLGGILTAALAHPPAPWIVNQTWSRIYRPYLQFLYLTNAYHFYSPEPGPSSHVWFYLYYTNAQGERLGHWYKIPKLDDSGRHGHVTSLEYQRHLSITEHTMGTERFVGDSPLFEKVAVRRDAWTPQADKQEPIVGKNPVKHEVVIPMNPTKTKSQQYHLPQRHIKRYVEAYARHVLRKHIDLHPDRKYDSVRIYRVVHTILSASMYFHGMDPTDPEFYMPVYMGEFDTTGKLLDTNDPFLYWELPILRDEQGIALSPIRDWARRHAGDPYWIRAFNQGRFQWVDDKGKPLPD